ncbi:MAG: hypothetical protein JWO12_2480, partial [Frankiales bacterium]|nr:hypothetical protein [Frankiales bacterium]
GELGSFLAREAQAAVPINKARPNGTRAVPTAR